MEVKRAVLLHGTDSGPAHNWQPWMKRELEALGYAVWAPELPNNHTPNRHTYNEFLLGEDWDFKDNILIGHSSGTTSILNLLLDERCPSIKAAVFVATFFEVSEQLRINPNFAINQFSELFPSEGFDFEKIMRKCQKFYFVHGDNDTLCPIELARDASNKLSGTFITIPGGGHIGGDSGITELPQVITAMKADNIL